MIHELSIRFYLWLVRRFERLERNESTAEHMAIELSHEWDHVTHLGAPLVHVAGRVALGALGTLGGAVVVAQAELWQSIGWIGSVLYVGQVITQIRLYGAKRWWQYGLGTGVPLREQETDTS